VELLLAAGGDPNVAATDGRTPLHEAASFGNVEAARALIRAGADPNAPDGAGLRPLDVARRYHDAVEVRDLVFLFEGG
jgi:ankyrin repeat protein